MDGEDSKDGDGEEAAAAADDTPAIVDGINNRSFPVQGRRGQGRERRHHGVMQARERRRRRQ